VGTKVLLAQDGGDWAYKCWSARGISGHKSVGPLKGIFYPSSIGTLTCVKSLETFVRALCHSIRTFHNSGSFLFFW
jgi:hypothetical protein